MDIKYIDYIDLPTVSPDMGARLATRLDGNRILKLIDYMHHLIGEWNKRTTYLHWEWECAEPVGRDARVAYWCEKLAYEDFQIWYYWKEPKLAAQAGKHNKARLAAIATLNELLGKTSECWVGLRPGATIGAILDSANIIRLWLYEVLALDPNTLKQLAQVQSLIDFYGLLRVRAAKLADQLLGMGV